MTPPPDAPTETNEADGLCAGPGCDDACLTGASCATTGTCTVERKHFRRGGMCCLSCTGTCFDCDGTFYWEGLTTLPEPDPDEDGDLVDVHLCHCCLQRRRSAS